MTRIRAAALATVLSLFAGYVLGSCQREDGLPDPPLRTLVPCLPDAGPDDPLACPPPAEVDADVEDAADSHDMTIQE